jgi:mannan endo-1,4-beta-mannosidase
MTVRARMSMTKTGLLISIGAAVVAAPFLLSADRDQSRRPLEWGIYQIYVGAPRFRAMLDGEMAKLASKPDYVMFYRDLDRTFPKKGVDIIRSVGATPIISLELWKWHDAKVKQLPRIVAGEFDGFFRKWAEDAKKDGRRVLLRFGFEFNGDWFTWAGDPKGYVRAWKRIRSIFAEVGADNVVWVWSPNITSHPGSPENRMHAYYPGDEHVDWVAVDGYNWGDDHKPWHKWTSFEGLFADVLDDFAKRYATKPVMIAETGCPEQDAGQKAAWVRATYKAILRRPQVRAVVWFNLDKRREGELDFRVDSSPLSLAAFNETFAKPARGKSRSGSP